MIKTSDNYINKKLKPIFFIFFFCLFIQSQAHGDSHLTKVLHLSFHLGCIKEFEAVAHYLPIELTSWYIHSNREQFDDQAVGAAIYNIGHDRAKRIWEKNKNYFNQFDIILTSDTAPLSRIFLQNGWKKPLIIWVCNRFDYADRGSLDCNFPDKEYYELFQKAAQLPNVKIISYTPYEHFYAKKKNVHWKECVVKPIGTIETALWHSDASLIPSFVDQKNTFFVNPRLESWGSHPGQQFDYLQTECESRNINVYMGKYSGPEDIKDFKGIIFFPYQWSNLVFFENIQRGIIHFVPTINFINALRKLNKPVSYNAEILTGNFELCEWYMPEHKDLIVYFASWDDLKEKIETIDYEAMHKKIKAFAETHREKMLTAWQQVFHLFASSGI